MENMSWMEQYSIVDACCARFADLADKKYVVSTGYVAQAIRALWKHADADWRATLATRVAVWRNHSKERTAQTQMRVLNREKVRLA